MLCTQGKSLGKPRFFLIAVDLKQESGLMVGNFLGRRLNNWISQLDWAKFRDNGAVSSASSTWFCVVESKRQQKHPVGRLA